METRILSWYSTIFNTTLSSPIVVPTNALLTGVLVAAACDTAATGDCMITVSRSNSAAFTVGPDGTQRSDTALIQVPLNSTTAINPGFWLFLPLAGQRLSRELYVHVAATGAVTWRVSVGLHIKV